MEVTGLILCAGTGARAGLGYNKLLYKVAGKTVLEHTIDKFECPLVLVASRSDFKQICRIAAKYKNVQVAAGGATRQESVAAGLEFIEEELSVQDGHYVIIHDGARPNVTPELIERALLLAAKDGSAVTYTPCTDTVKVMNESGITSLRRTDLINIQTPQVFEFAKIKKAYENIEEGEEFTDDSGVYENTFVRCSYCLGDSDNYKITTMGDLTRFEYENTDALVINNVIEKERLLRMKIGSGYDVHKFVVGRKLILGGVEIPHYEGLEGHSDADVLTHAVMDAILSAAGERDIGVHFPDKDEKYKGASSITLLAKVIEMVTAKGYRVGNISAIIHAERPKLAAYIQSMQVKLSEVMGIPETEVAINATTHEGLGAIGRREGIAASASCLLTVPEQN